MLHIYSGMEQDFLEVILRTTTLKQPHVTTVCFSSQFFCILYPNRLSSKLLNESIKFCHTFVIMQLIWIC